jgi:Ca2+-binding RTX toxin-like protein
MMMFNFDPNLDGPTYKAGDPIPLDRNDTVFPFTSAHHLDTPLTGPLNGASGASHNHGSMPATPASTATPATAPPTISPLIVANFRHSAWGTEKSDLIEATAQDSYLNGRAGDDDLQGRGGNDMLVGGHGDDYIAGWGGDDLLAGEIGSDTLVGGVGRDGFYFITADPTSTDLISDFEAGSDFISLHHALVNTNGSGTSSWSYIGPDAFRGVKGEVRFINSRLEVDLDGNRISDINVLMPGITSFEPSWLNVPAAASKGSDLL